MMSPMLVLFRRASPPRSGWGHRPRFDLDPEPSSSRVEAVSRRSPTAPRYDPEPVRSGQAAATKPSVDPFRSIVSSEGPLRDLNALGQLPLAGILGKLLFCFMPLTLAVPKTSLIYDCCRSQAWLFFSSSFLY